MISMSYISSDFPCDFSTEDRRRLIAPPLRERLWPFFRGIARQNELEARKEELLALLKKHRIAFDKRYLWE
jgi:hypothetical protein